MFSALPAILKAVTPLLDKFVTDPGQRAKFNHEISLAVMEQEQEAARLASQEKQAQINVNREAAASGDKFTSRARPACIYTLLFLFALGYVVPVFLGIYCQVTGVDYSYQAPDVEFAWAALTGLLGLGGMRGWDKHSARQSFKE